MIIMIVLIKNNYVGYEVDKGKYLAIGESNGEGRGIDSERVPGSFWDLWV